MSSLHQRWQRVLLEALVLVIVAVAVGLSINYRMVMNAFSGHNVVAVGQPLVSGVETKFPLPVDYVELDGLLAAGALLVDARDRQIYADAHLPGAIALPLAEIDAQLSDFRAKVPYTTPLIIYCNGFGCPDSFDLGMKLLTAGYLDVQVYEGGFPEWRDKNRRLESGAAE